MCDQAIIRIFWAGARRRAPVRHAAPLEGNSRIDGTQPVGRTRNRVKSQKSDTWVPPLE
jgi:hypothetical protein